MMQQALGRYAAILICLLPVMAVAQDAVPKAGFTFKRVKVGGEVPGKRMTIQIDPVEQARLLAALPVVEPRTESLTEEAIGPVMPAAPAGAKYDWFWETVPVQQDQVAGRFPLALATLSLGPGGSTVTAPRLQPMQDLASSYGIEILKATVGTNVSPALVLAVIGIESAGKADAVSSAGAQGLMQLIPATAERFGVTDATDPAQNIKGGVAYLNWLMNTFDSDPVMVLAAYNAGEGAVATNSGVPPYAETRDYVPKVLAAWVVARGLCLTPPELVTDPCVFKVNASGG